VKRTGVVPSTRALLALVAAAALPVACYEFTGPAPAPNLLLTGSFYLDLTNVPGGGAADTMTLSAAYGHVTGSGVEYILGRFYSAFSVTGQYSDTTQSFVLEIRYTKGAWPTDYTGSVYGADSLSGRVPTYTSPGYNDWVFYRLPVPPCADSAPRYGAAAPAPGALVQFHDGVDATAEAALLGDRYGFVVTRVYQTSFNGFFADLSQATMTVLRCEPSVKSIQYEYLSATR